MLAEEPMLQDLLEGRSGLKTLLYIPVIGGVLGLAWLRNRRAAAQESTRKEAVQ